MNFISDLDPCGIRWEVHGWEFRGQVADRFVTNPKNYGDIKP